MVKMTKNPIDLFKPLKRGDRCTSAYLYADGHATARFERRIKDADTSVNYYKQIDSLGVRCRIKGRIVFSDMSGGLPWLRAMMAAGAVEIYASAASLHNGTPATQDKGIAVAYLAAEIPGIGTVFDYGFPSLQAPGWTIQDDVTEAFDRDLERYSYHTGDTVAETLVTIVHPIEQAGRW